MFSAPTEETDWHQCVLWGSRAQNLAEQLRRGHLVYVEGRLVTRTYEDDAGVKHRSAEVRVNTWRNLGAPARSEEPVGAGGESDQADVQVQEPAASTPA